jgi:hypothetical protein
MTMRLRRAVTGAILPSLIALASAPASATWVFETPNGQGTTAPQTALVVGTSGAHILFIDAPTQTLVHLQRVGANQWTHDTLGPQAGFALALDAAGNPHVALAIGRPLGVNSTTFSLIHGVKPAGSTQWSFASMAADQSTNIPISLPSIAIGSDGAVHIAYRFGQQIKHAVNPTGALTGGWTTTVVDGGGTLNKNMTAPSLALKPGGVPAISYVDVSDNSLKYAERLGGTGAAWRLDTADGLGDVISLNSLAVDAAGHPHIAFYDSSRRLVQWTTWVPGTTSFMPGPVGTGEIIASGVSPGGSLAIVLDSGGRPHVAFESVVPGVSAELRYATRTGTNTWVSESVDRTGFAGSGISAALDGAGQPALSYTWTPGGSQPLFGLKFAGVAGATLINPPPGRRLGP